MNKNIDFCYKDVCNLHNLPMTLIEKQLKIHYKKYMQNSEHIFTSEEMKDYMTWLIHSSINKKSFSTDEIPSMLIDTDITQIGIRLLNNAKDKDALKLLTAQYETQTESYFFPKNQDITTCRILRYMPSYWHKNSFFEVYYAFSGNTPIYFEKETLVMTPGTVLIIPPYTMQACGCLSDDSVVFSITIRSSTFSKIFVEQLSHQNLMSLFFKQALNGTGTTSFLYFHAEQDITIENLLCYIDREFRSDDCYRVQIINTSMSLFFLLLLQKYENSARVSTKNSLSWKPVYLSLFHYIQEHYATITLQELSVKFNYSQRQIIRIIQNCTGKTFSQLLIMLRMEKAVQFLSNFPEISLGEIAAKVGYSTLSSFYRTFTAYYGCSPKDYLHMQITHSDFSDN